MAIVIMLEIPEEIVVSIESNLYQWVMVQAVSSAGYVDPFQI